MTNSNDGYSTTVSTGTASYIVEQADLRRDRDLIIDLWSRNLHSHTPEEHAARFDWHYGENQTGRARCFLLRNERSGAVVGTTGVGVRELECAGKTLAAGIAIDFAVEREHRFLQPALLLTRRVAALLQEDLDLVYALPNQAAIGVFRRVGYQTHGSFRRFVAIMDPAPFVARSRCPRILRSPVGNAARIAFRSWNTLAKMTHPKFALVELDWADQRLTQLWNRCQSQAPVIGRRTVEYLDWRFRRCPLHRHRVLGLFRDGCEELLGYVVVYADEGQLKVPDFLLVSKQRLRYLLFSLSRWARQEKWASIAVETMNPPPDLVREFKSSGYFDRGAAGILLTNTRVEADLAKWYFLRGDEFYNTF